eukprot:snap_masked-scaffold_57-processed-gene-0.44-mRNA-1 protein AED:1.00 eAED:1.00 QI:0/0/0/0/1/1/2/0/211
MRQESALGAEKLVTLFEISPERMHLLLKPKVHYCKKQKKRSTIRFLEMSTPEETERNTPAIEQVKNLKLEIPWVQQREEVSRMDGFLGHSDPGYTDYAWKAKEATKLLLEENNNGSLSEKMDDYKTIFYDTELEVGIGENLEQKDSNEEERMNEKLGMAISSVEGLDRKKVDEYWNILQKHREAFGDKICKAQMSTLNDMKMTMKPGMSPV